MSILPKKKFIIDYTDNPISFEDSLRNEGYNQAIDECQESLDKAIERAADVERLTEIFSGYEWVMVNGNDCKFVYPSYLAEAVSAHIKKELGGVKNIICNYWLELDDCEYCKLVKRTTNCSAQVKECICKQKLQSQNLSEHISKNTINITDGL